MNKYKIICTNQNSLLKELGHGQTHLELPLHVLLGLEGVLEGRGEHVGEKLERERQGEFHKRNQNKDRHGDQPEHVRHGSEELLPLPSREGGALQRSLQHLPRRAEVGHEELAAHPVVMGLLLGRLLELDELVAELQRVGDVVPEDAGSFGEEGGYCLGGGKEQILGLVGDRLDERHEGIGRRGMLDDHFLGGLGLLPFGAGLGAAIQLGIRRRHGLGRHCVFLFIMIIGIHIGRTRIRRKQGPHNYPRHGLLEGGRCVRVGQQNGASHFP